MQSNPGTRNKDKTIISFFDYTGEWCKPYKMAGYDVYQFDLKLGYDIYEIMERVITQKVDNPGFKVHGILAAPPCTDFARSGAHLWKGKLFRKDMP